MPKVNGVELLKKLRAARLTLYRSSWPRPPIRNMNSNSIRSWKLRPACCEAVPLLMNCWPLVKNVLHARAG